MKLFKFLLTFICFFMIFSVKSQLAGITNLTLWMKANQGVTVAGSNVTQWADQSGNGHVFTEGVAANQPIISSFQNYNPLVNFVSSDKLEDGSAAISSMSAGREYFGFTKAANTGVLVYFGQNPAVNQANFSYAQTNVKYSGSPLYASEAHNSYTNNAFPTIANISSANGALSDDINFSFNDGDFSPTVTYLWGTPPYTITPNIDFLTIGAKRTTTGSFNNYLSGQIGDIVTFGKVLNDSERKNVRSYLAIKYGVTLTIVGSLGTVGDYVASNNLNLWKSSINPSFHNNVIGIGRDDDYSLIQKQSQNTANSLRIYINTLQATNVLNTGNFTDNISFALIGDNQGQLCTTTAINTEVPTGYSITSRIEREWKIKRTNLSQNFTIEINLDPCANVGNINPLDLRLLVNTADPNMVNASVYNSGAGFTISYSAGLITLSGISTSIFPDDTTSYFTIASINILTPLPVELVSFKAEQINNDVELVWKTATEINSDNFHLFRSINGYNWDQINVQKAAGNSTNEIIYKHIDREPNFGINYYKLVQTDLNGISKSYPVISCLYDMDLNELKVYPNPSSGNINLLLPDGIVHIAIIDQIGKIVYQIKDFPVSKNKATEISIENLKQGVYQILVTDVTYLKTTQRIFFNKF